MCRVVGELASSLVGVTTTVMWALIPYVLFVLLALCYGAPRPGKLYM